MLSELFTYITTRCPRYVRRMGYLSEAIGLKCRYKRHLDSWRHHLEKTRQFVLFAASKSQRREKVIILGSGLLLDVPLETLSSMFREVVLIDIVCLPEVHRCIKGYDNVRFLQQDVTNIAGTLYQNILYGRHELPSADPVLPEIGKDTGLVISLNILSQLTVVLRKYALKKLTGIATDHVEAWCRQITESHMPSLCLCRAMFASLPTTVIQSATAMAELLRKAQLYLEYPCPHPMIHGHGTLRR